MSERTDTLIDSAVERFGLLWELYDVVRVSFSGGKDSTALMEIGALAAKRYGRVLDVDFYDEEIIWPQTEAYCRRVRERADIRFSWHCIPLRENNAWDRENPYWFPWQPGVEWARPMPDFAIENQPGYDSSNPMSLEKLTSVCARAVMPKTLCHVVGIRAAEGSNRRGQKDTFIRPPTRERLSTLASPIFHWTDRDVWSAILERGWDWNRAYHAMYRAGRTVRQLRVGPFFGEEPSRTVHELQRASPETWLAATRRIPGISSIARYANSAIMGRGRIARNGTVTRNSIERAFLALPVEKQREAKASIRYMVMQALNSRMPVPSNDAMRIALRGDSKASRRAMGQVLTMYMVANLRGKPRSGPSRKRAEQWRAIHRRQNEKAYERKGLK